MIVVTFSGVQNPMVGRIRGWAHDSTTKGPSVLEAIRSAMSRFRKEPDGFLFVASGGRINSARVYPALRHQNWSIAAHVDRIGTIPDRPCQFNGIGRLSLETLLVRANPATDRILDRWGQRNAVVPGREEINLAITLAEMEGVTFLHLPSEWVWRESEMRAHFPTADPVVEFPSRLIGQLESGPKITALASSAVAPKSDPSKALPPGVLWVGHLYQYTGYGKANREILFRIANSMSVRIDDSHQEPVYVREDLRARLDVHRKVLVAPRAPLLRIMGPDKIGHGVRHRIVWTMQETSVRVHEDMVRRANENFDELWTPSNWNAEVFRESGVQIPIRVMQLGVDPILFRPLGRRTLLPCRLISTARRGRVGVPEGFVFLTVGLPGFRKGWDVIADAAEMAFKGKKNVHVVIALTHSPPEWNAKVYKQFANYKVPIWTLEGSFDEHEMAKIYCGSNVYVSASRGEGFNLPAAEAAACGLPVIVPDNTCHTEIFGPEGNLFKPDGVKKYPEGDWISDWYKGQLFSRFGAPSIRRLADLMTAAVGGRGLKSGLLRDKILSTYTWDAAAARAAARLMEVQPT